MNQFMGEKSLFPANTANWIQSISSSACLSQSSNLESKVMIVFRTSRSAKVRAP